MKEYICMFDEDDMNYVPNPYLKDNELIRCKDCKHWKSVVHFDVAEYGLCTARTVLQTEPRNGFCHRAVRRDK